MSLIFKFYSAVITRETRKLLKQKDKLASAMVRPFLWLWIIGGGMQALAGPDYIARLIPGIVGMSLLFGGMVGGLSIAFDKDSGTMRLLVTSPVRHVHVLLAKSISAAIAALVQTGLLLAALALFEGLYWLLQSMEINLQVILPWTGYLTWPNLPLLLPVLCLSAISCGLLGVAVGVTAKTIDSFAVMMNFVIFPLFFLSGALYPIAPMPALARWAASINPFTYSVDLLRHVFTSHAEFAMIHSMGYLLASALLMLAFSLWRFSQNGAALPLSQ